MKKKALTLLGWIISVALLASLASRLDFHSIGQHFRLARWPLLIAAAALNLAVVALKALRWQWIMNPAQRSSYRFVFRATMIGLAGNNLLPARGGDWLRIYLLGKWEGVSKTMMASVTGMDKLFDGLAILLLFGVLSFHSNFPDWVLKGTIIVSIVTVISLVICVLLLLHHQRQERLPIPMSGRASRIASALGSGMVILARRRLILFTLLLSFVICWLQIETLRLCQLAFNMHLDIWIPAILFVAINLAIIVPSAPSGVGPFEVAAVLAYTWLGVDVDMAFSIALAYHTVQFIPVTVIGVAFYLHSGVRRARREIPNTK